MIWTGPIDGRVPVARVPGYRDLFAVRRLMLLEYGPIQPGTLATATCGNPLCVNPAHVRGVTRKKLAQVTAKHNLYHQNPVRNARISAKARKKFTPEQALQILSDPRPQRAIADDWGVAQSTIGDIKMGRTYQFGVGNPFAGLGAR